MLKLIKYCVCILLLVALSCKSFGQYRIRMPVERRQPPFRERVVVQAPAKRLELIKENYISRRLNLTFDQARQFWPLYRRYVQDQTAIRIAKQQAISQPSSNDPNYASRLLEYETELVNVRKHYLEEFNKILPPEKVNELYQAEREFNEEMLRQLGERAVRAGN